MKQKQINFVVFSTISLKCVSSTIERRRHEKRMLFIMEHKLNNIFINNFTKKIQILSMKRKMSTPNLKIKNYNQQIMQKTWLT